MTGPPVEVQRRLDDETLRSAINDAQSAGKARLIRRLCFVRNLYAGDSISEAADRVGVSQPTGSRWLEAWNAEGVVGLEPEFSDGRPPKLEQEERRTFLSTVERYLPLTTEQVQEILEKGFDVSYSERHLARLLSQEGIEVDSGAGTGNRSTHRDSIEQGTTPANTEQNLQAALAAVTEDCRD